MAEGQSTVTYRDIPGRPGYRVGDDGSVWSCKLRTRGNVYVLSDSWRRLKTPRTVTGYLEVSLGRSVHLVHRLVLLAFVGPCPDGMECCHFDGDRTNNALNNLRWDTGRANAQDRVRQGTSEHGERNPSAKLTEADVRVIRQLRRQGLTQKQLAVRYGVTRTNIAAILSRRSWGWLE